MIGLAVAPEVLLWDERSRALRQRVETEYAALLHEAFRHRYLAGRNGGVTERELKSLATAVPAENVARVVLAPRSARRLLWPRAGEAARTRRFLGAALQAERAVAGLDGVVPEPGWTADCRAYIRADGSVVDQPTIADGAIPLDLRSPHARSLDLMGGSRIVRGIRPAPSGETAARMIERLQTAWQGIRATEGTTADCVISWTRVIVPQSEPSGMFWSGSNGEYVGRVVLVNVDQERVSIEEIVDALVHEAIHGFLYMHESVEPWVVDFSLYTDEGAIMSPWSRNLLPVRPFMQACFVWFGLATFWGQHVDGSLFDQERTHYLLGRALSGFCGEPLADLLAPSRGAIRPELVELIDEMQRTIRSLVA